LSDRKKRYDSIASVLKHIQDQLKDHESGKKLIEKERRIDSLKERVEAYENQLKDLTKELNDEVGRVWGVWGGCGIVTSLYFVVVAVCCWCCCGMIFRGVCFCDSVT
jgi:hypothetical protein